MAVKRKKKITTVKPYDPYRPYGNHSAGWFTGEANRRAASDANAAVAALPSASFYTQSAQQLGDALKGIAGQQGTVAAAASPLYAQAFDSASQAANKAALVGGGTGVTATPGGGSLVGALGATMAQALSGGQSAAVARGRNDVIARAGQETAIRAKQVSAAADYLKQMRDEALQASVAGFNNQLAQSQFGLSATNTAFDNNLAAASLDAQIAGDAAATDTKRTTNLNKAMAAARNAANEIKVGTKGKVVVGKDYKFNVPNSMVSEDPTASGTQEHTIRAKDGTSALAAFKTWLSSLPGYDASYNPQTFYTGQSAEITEERVTPGSRSAQLHAALNALMDAGLDRATALQYAREIIGSRKLIKQKKKPKRDPNAGGK